MPPGYSLPESYAERTACTFDRRAYGPNQYFAEATGKREPWQTHHSPSGGTVKVWGRAGGFQDSCPIVGPYSNGWCAANTDSLA